MDGSSVIDVWRRWRRERKHYPGHGSFAGIVYCGLGLGEAGELAGEIKKAWRDDHSEENNRLTPDRVNKIIHEMGDVFWYLDTLCDELNITLDDVLIANMHKINAREAQRGG